MLLVVLNLVYVEVDNLCIDLRAPLAGRAREYHCHHRQLSIVNTSERKYIKHISTWPRTMLHSRPW